MRYCEASEIVIELNGGHTVLSVEQYLWTQEILLLVLALNQLPSGYRME